MTVKLTKALMAVLVLAGQALAQGACKQDITLNKYGQPAPGTVVRVCDQNATGTVCTPLSTVFRDAALTIPINQTTAPIQSDAFGNYSFCANSGYYKVQYTTGGVTFTLSDMTLTAPSLSPGINAQFIQGKPVSTPSATGCQLTYDGTTNVNCQTKPVIDVRDKGCIGDGSADDTACIQSAIDLVRATGGTVLFPPGHYKVTAPIDISLLQTGKFSYSVRLLGSAPVGLDHIDGFTGDTAIICAMASGARCIDARSSQGLTIDGINIKCNNNTFTGYLIDLSHDSSGSDAALWEIKNLGMGGTSAVNLSTKGINVSLAIEGRIARVNFSYMERAINTDYATYSNGIEVVNSQFYHLVNFAIYGYGTNWEVHSNVFEGCFPLGVSGAAFPCGIAASSGSSALQQDLSYHSNYHESGLGGLGTWIQINSFGNSVFANYIGGSSTNRNVTSVARVSKVVSVVVSANVNVQAGAIVNFTGVTDATFNHPCYVTAVADLTHFTCEQNFADASSSGGTVNIRSVGVAVYGGTEGTKIFSNDFDGGSAFTSIDPGFGGSLCFDFEFYGNHYWGSSTVPVWEAYNSLGYGSRMIGLGNGSIVAGQYTPLTHIYAATLAGSGTSIGLGTEGLLFPASVSGNGVVGVGGDLMQVGHIMFPTDATYDIGTTSTGNYRPRDGTFSRNLSSSRYTSTVATGTAPLTVTSTTQVSNLNASLLQGLSFIPLTDTPGAITVNANTCTDRAVAFATAKTSATITLAANYAMEANIAPEAGQTVLNTAFHYRICNHSIANITLAAGATFNLTAIQ